MTTETIAKSPDLIGGKYEIAGNAQKGGSGEVFRVYDHRLQKIWAAKKVSKECPGMEASALGKLSPDCFPRIVDVVEEADCRYLIMDWIEGESLQDRLKREGAMAEEEAIAVGTALCDAIGVLHRMQPPLLYLDCKPSNIMTDQSGKLWLIDFGSALESAEPEVEPFSGSFGYAAPEQFGLCAGKRRADVRSDVYGLGRTLYALLSGMDPAKPPYGACPLRDCNPEASPGLIKIVERCVREQPEERFQTMEAVKNALLALKEKKRGTALRHYAASSGTWLLLGLTLWRAWIFYERLNEPTSGIREKLLSLFSVILFAAAAHLWQHFAVEQAYCSRCRWEAEPIQSVLRTEKKAGRWLFAFLLCCCICGTSVVGQDGLTAGAVHAQERIDGNAAEKEKLKSSAGAQDTAGPEAVKLPIILRDAKMRKLLIRDGCALKSNEPVFLELVPEAFMADQEVEICVTATMDGTVQEYRFWYEPGQCEE